MAQSSKSSQKAKNVVIALLALWSIISLIVIVVWATSPDLKSSAKCRAELQDTTEKMEGAKVVWNKNKVALEELVEAAREEQGRLRAEVLLLLGRLNATNVTLEECRQENVVLNGNISVLQENVEQLRQTEANLTRQLSLQEEHIDALQDNVTQAFHQTMSCFSLKDAADSQMMAAKSQTKACESKQQYLEKQLLKCKDVDSEAAQQTNQQAATPLATPAPGAASPLAAAPALMLLICSTLHLITWWTAASRSLWTDKPWIIVSSDEIKDGETVEVTCTLPIDYRGGDCRLFRENAPLPFRLKRATGFLCVFHLTSQQLLGEKPVGSRIHLKCDYHIQQYTSGWSDVQGVTVWGSSPSPALSVSRRFVSPDDGVEVTCSPPNRFVSSCSFYRDKIIVATGSCSRNLTGKQLAIWEKSTTLLPVNMTCRYYPDKHLDIRSELSNHNLLFVVDASQVSSSVDCKVFMEGDQPAFRGSDRTFVGADGQTVNIKVTNSSLIANETCSNIQSHTRLM